MDQRTTTGDTPGRHHLSTQCLTNVDPNRADHGCHRPFVRWSLMGSRRRGGSEGKRRWRGCDRLFQPSSRHLLCPACRRQASQDECACGNLKQPTSATCRDCQPTGGKDNGNWRGGRTFHKAGYVIRRAPSQTRAHPKSLYVFEHILVMEKKIGRLLHPDESVHHRNGVKDDNRPENLELWVRPQPSGIRAFRRGRLGQGDPGSL